MKTLKISTIAKTLVIGSLLCATGVMASEFGTGKINAMAFAKNDLIVDMTSTEETQVPDMTVSFKGQGYAIVRFCANGNMFGTGSGATQVTAQLDGVQLGDEIQFFTINDSAASPRCFEWITDSLLPGTHTATIFARLTATTGAELVGRFHDSVLTVHYRIAPNKR